MPVNKNKTQRTSVALKKVSGGSIAAPDKLLLLITVVDRSKADFYTDLLGSFDVNMQMVISAHGTATKEILGILGLGDSERSVILSIIRKDKSAAAMSMLDDKFKTVKGGKGIAYTVPLSGTIGVAIYQFLSNNKGGL